MPPSPRNATRTTRKKDTLYSLDKAQVGVVLGKFRADGTDRPLSALTVYRYWKDVPGHYVDNPFPKPAIMRGRTPFWLSTQIPDLEKWAKSRVGMGAGGGRPWSRALLDDGYVPCAQCRHPVERHDTAGCHPLRGSCACTERHWTPAKIQGARLAAGLDERFVLEGSAI